MGLLLLTGMGESRGRANASKFENLITSTLTVV